jgi:cytoskeletal protein CcmA (bactofilin family)
MADYTAIRQQWDKVGLAKRFSRETAEGEPAPAEDSAPNGTFISSGAIFEGTLSLQGDFHIDTEFRGELETDGRITVGPNGSVVGDLRGREVVIRGAVVGDVTAPRQLIVEAGGKLHGDIETACLEIQKHAFFQGRTAMTLPQVGRLAALDAANESAGATADAANESAGATASAPDAPAGAQTSTPEPAPVTGATAGPAA